MQNFRLNAKKLPQCSAQEFSEHIGKAVSWQPKTLE